MGPRISEEKGLFPPFSGFSRCSSAPPEKGEEGRKRAKKADFGRFPGGAARHPLNPHLLHPHLRQPNFSFSGTLSVTFFGHFLAKLLLPDSFCGRVILCKSIEAPMCNPVDLVLIHLGPPPKNGEENGRKLETGLTPRESFRVIFNLSGYFHLARLFLETLQKYPLKQARNCHF